MAQLLVTIEPYDTMVFRDGRPFEQDDQGLAETVDVFPPPPPAVTGAVRVALAAALGVPSGSSWSDAANVLAAAGEAAKADALRLLPKLEVIGPLLFDPNATGAVEERIYVPCPFSLLFAKVSLLFAKESIVPVGRLLPYASTNHQINGLIAGLWPLHAAPFPSAKMSHDDVPGAGHYISLATLKRHLRRPGSAPVTPAQHNTVITEREQRVGIAVDKATGRAEDGMLFTASHQRLKGWRIAALIEDRRELDAITEVDAVAPFGGEGRFARVRLHRADGPITAFTPHDQGLNIKHHAKVMNVAVIALTPVPVNAALPGFCHPAWPGAVCVAAAHERPVTIGYAHRDFARGRRESEIIRAYPAGSVWFWQIPIAKAGGARAKLDELAQSGRLAPPDLAELGFGAFMAGTW